MKLTEEIQRLGYLRTEVDGTIHELDKKLSELEKEKQEAATEEAIAINKATKKQRKTTVISLSAIALIILALIIIVYTTQDAITGFSVYTKETRETIKYDRLFEHNTETQLELNNLTGFRISGVLEGTRATIKLRINGTEYIIGEITKPQESEGGLITGLVTGEEVEQPQYAISTDKTSYVVGETVYITITPATENASIYVNYGEETHKLEGNIYLPTTAGEYQAIALIVLPEDVLRIETNFTVIEQTTEPTEEINNGINTTINETSLSNETLPEEPVTNETNTTTNETITNETTIETPLENTSTYAFTNICTETCTITETSNPILIIELEGDSKLTINELIVTQNKENNAPEQTKEIQNIELQPGEETTLNLDEYFTDTDEDNIEYDINEIPEINTTIIQNELTITGTTTGTYLAYIYATDGDKLVTSNTFTINIAETANTTINETTNETINQTQLPINNETTNTTTNETNENITTEITTDECSNPDINLRPSSCFVGLENQAFEELTVELQNKDRGRVGMFTRYGNLMIRGLLIENSQGEPSSSDFQIGFSETQGFTETKINTAWISTESGNLNLRGKIYENQEVLNPSQFNTFIIRNKYNIILGYFDEQTGDLYLRGNIVQLGKI